MAVLSIRGTFLAASKVQLVGQNQMQTRKFWMELDNGSSYKNFAEFKLLHDNVVKVEDIKKDQEIEVFFKISGRKHVTEKDGEKKELFFQELQAYRIDILERTTAGVPAVNPESISNPGDEEDKLPF